MVKSFLDVSRVRFDISIFVNWDYYDLLICKTARGHELMTLDLSDIGISPEEAIKLKTKAEIKIKEIFKMKQEDHNIILMHNDLEMLQIFQKLIASPKSKKDICTELKMPITSAYRKFNDLEKLGLIVKVG